ncbi:hypothetical protein HAX54_014952 [Datura stramonium]|uniref:Uncharacterized protein n=1 Tax=Datura stramonium TaxID=4076 RepID=A0ABS8TRT7_DATST|nr:hypothetical protein [Datura stramonium]
MLHLQEVKDIVYSALIANATFVSEVMLHLKEVQAVVYASSIASVASVSKLMLHLQEVEVKYSDGFQFQLLHFSSNDYSNEGTIKNSLVGLGLLLQSANGLTVEDFVVFHCYRSHDKGILDEGMFSMAPGYRNKMDGSLESISVLIGRDVINGDCTLDLNKVQTDMISSPISSLWSTSVQQLILLEYCLWHSSGSMDAMGSFSYLAYLQLDSIEKEEIIDMLKHGCSNANTENTGYLDVKFENIAFEQLVHLSYCHWHCYIYVCSILPTASNKIIPY